MSEAAEEFWDEEDEDADGTGEGGVEEMLRVESEVDVEAEEAVTDAEVTGTTGGCAAAGRRATFAFLSILSLIFICLRRSSSLRARSLSIRSSSWRRFRRASFLRASRRRRSAGVSSNERWSERESEMDGEVAEMEEKRLASLAVE